LKGYGIVAMQGSEGFDNHERLKELCALAQADSLSIAESLDLERHLEVCAACRDLYDQYSVVGEEGMAYLSQTDAMPEEAEIWDHRGARERLLTSIREQRLHKVLSIKAGLPSRKRGPASSIAKREWAIAVVAACAIVAVALGAYQIGERRDIHPPASSTATVASQPAAEQINSASADLSAFEKTRISALEQQISRQEQELAKLRTGTGLADARVNELEGLNRNGEADFRQLAEERDKLASQLAESENAYQKLQADFTSLKADYNRSLLRTASLESDVTSLTALTHDQERRVKDDEQYLVSDRDIRELMGARKLYIADVFDVDSASRTKKPFGRVFYTQNKSLVFYAFDLDHQPGVKNAGDFQVWGQRDSESNGASHPMNLGILYMDSESNRRWVLRSDDPRQLAEIDAVFVTVEPHGGSQKPTGKPLLYALLRKEANHP
jgi:anti-sigma-K factor RskA